MKLLDHVGWGGVPRRGRTSRRSASLVEQARERRASASLTTALLFPQVSLPLCNRGRRTAELRRSSDGSTKQNAASGACLPSLQGQWVR